MAAQLTTDAAALVSEAGNFQRIADEIKAVITRVEQAATALDNHWQGIAADAAKQALTRYHDAATAQVGLLNEVSTNLHTAGVQYSATDDERAEAIAAAMSNGMNRDGEREHNGVQLVDWKQGPTQTPGPGHTGQDVRDAIKDLPKGTKDNFSEIRSEQDLRNLWNWASEGASEHTGSSYPGTERVLADGTIIGLRESDKFGTTMEIHSPNNKDYAKVHVNTERGGVPNIPSGRAGSSAGAAAGANAPSEPAPAGRAPAGAAPVEPAPLEPPAPRPAPAMPMGPNDPNAFPHPVQPPHSHHGPPVLGRDDMSDLPEYEPE
ncbi:WXG100 family type VII secretion target [Mycobacterium kyorinense]|uniref:WXG100 family type VII secretion target n=1 Tax=Mycobacterium kyorinense TaxID=487514 RepID=UPI00084CCF3D|nr:WXG100 family type VII secretion target [Mycobacterium kyorinense]